MASKAFLCAILLGGLHSFVAAPAIHKPRSSPPPMLVSMEPRSGWGSQEALSSESDNIHVDEIDSLLIAPPAGPTAHTKSTSDIPNYPFSFSYISPTPTTSAEPVITVTVTEEESTTITASASPTTVTKVITFTYSASASSSAPPPIPSPTHESTPGSSKAIWVAPKDFSDLDSFQISRYSGGKKNIKIVTGIPAKASATAVSSSKVSESESPIPWDNASAVMQLLYPAHSIDPAQKPQGGADFYAAPLDISDATNATLQYSVFFPYDFDWVLAGKLPGLYGGHTGCSGGNAALTCFSTRLMWRQEGAGELYLYAPKDKQTKELCDDPKSNCDEAYGLSIGRGAFKWAAGSWTTVQQTISLNTPGKQDGSFVLHVNGELKIERNDVFYREDLSGGKPKPKPKTTHAPSKTTTSKPNENPTSTSTDDGDEDPLGPILGGILGGLRRRDGGATRTDIFVRNTHDLLQMTAIPDSQGPTAIAASDPGFVQSATPHIREPTSSPRPPTATDNSFGTEAVKETEVKLIGIFFSTFFGGHEDKYATPRDQYVWFKDFALSYNS